MALSSKEGYHFNPLEGFAANLVRTTSFYAAAELFMRSEIPGLLASLGIAAIATIWMKSIWKNSLVKQYNANE